MFKFLHDIDVAKKKLLNTINNKLALPNEDDECHFPGDEETMRCAIGVGECSLPRKGHLRNGEEEDDNDGEDDSSESDKDDSTESNGNNVSESDGEAKRSVRNRHEESNTCEDNEKREDEIGGVEWRGKDATSMCGSPQGDWQAHSDSDGSDEHDQPDDKCANEPDDKCANQHDDKCANQRERCAVPLNEAKVSEERKRSYPPKLKKETKTGTNIHVESTFYDHLKEKVANHLCCKVQGREYDEVVKQMILLRNSSDEKAKSMVETEKNQSTERNCSLKQHRKMAVECATKICDLVLGDRTKVLEKLRLLHSGDEENVKEQEEKILRNDEEIIELRRRNKMLNDINERQTKQLLQLSCQLSSNIKSDSETSERNYISAKVDSMEKELSQLKGEVAMLEELANDKNVHVKKNYELGCLIKSMEISLQKKSHLCASLWREKHQLQEKLQRCREKVQHLREDLRVCRYDLLDMQRSGKRLAFQIRGFIRAHGDRTEGIFLRCHKRKGRLKIHARSENGTSNDLVKDPTSEHSNGAIFESHPNSVYPPRRTCSVDLPRRLPAGPQSHTFNYCTGAGANRCSNRDTLEELACKLKNYKFFIEEWKSSHIRNEKKKDAELKETKKLLSQQVTKNEMLEKKYQSLLEKMRSLDRGPHNKGSDIDSAMRNVADGEMHCEGSHQDGVCPQTEEFIDEVNFLTREVEKLREDQVLLQEDVKKKSTIILHLIKKHPLSEEHFRLDNNLPILNNKLTYDEMRKIMEETLIENIRLRSDLLTLAKCVQGDSTASCVGQDNSGA
ncbi:conserved Plasmodium protein, unknown function [Plasmodium knowlesi strain H]|uniref:Uncharacterized protein n=3 Tax=Plasmodium knowlesi TaxID=5850 RepID=A0A5K1V332_PLAKH|nr:conserved Plasmodium protein, unknown function [Plasmodium knowlesi strain H]OTN64644.1 Uncharacterized protein PKNOH_S130207400 [Plasmodium knowlesi]CAA9989235.1 conserved Plasmodium protein, unknown function [Plasmodium knowlesi strain H]SBO26205.1 conserved Plasmodium protein, unknown function [Plasmodium knowlesi strain H]SBO27114.1 conserved Plasmodium protein, unknown function [Plasmodium knowlesi strain H]VVS78709.1 conserved Plasmodium protein, unknown function [Plasmodium knowlesi |eukprot:XP_002261581.1 hypothetical protein, conserved in Plasmodium species [Plasmodium knowlesi strain H]